MAEPAVLAGLERVALVKRNRGSLQFRPPSFESDTQISARSLMPSIFPVSPTYCVLMWRLGEMVTSVLPSLR